MNKLIKKMCGLLLLAPIISTANELDAYLLIDPQNGQGFEIKSQHFSERDLYNLNKYADHRNLSVILPSWKLRISTPETFSQVDTLIEELSNILDKSVNIKSVIITEMSLSPQAGGIPGT